MARAAWAHTVIYTPLEFPEVGMSYLARDVGWVLNRAKASVKTVGVPVFACKPGEKSRRLSNLSLNV